MLKVICLGLVVTCSLLRGNKKGFLIENIVGSGTVCPPIKWNSAPSCRAHYQHNKVGKCNQEQPPPPVNQHSQPPNPPPLFCLCHISETQLATPTGFAAVNLSRMQPLCLWMAPCALLSAALLLAGQEKHPMLTCQGRISRASMRAN